MSGVVSTLSAVQPQVLLSTLTLATSANAPIQFTTDSDPAGVWDGTQWRRTATGAEVWEVAFAGNLVTTTNVLTIYKNGSAYANGKVFSGGVPTEAENFTPKRVHLAATDYFDIRSSSTGPISIQLWLRRIS